ncbi:MAG: DUF4870 domain-containing protein [Planctomycetaceae bacterium]|nr:DUF4870 domain-containing protein [Planctomycetaceae bacterium]
MDQNTRTWAMLLHFSVFLGYIIPFAGLIAPILIWQLKKGEMPEIDAHGKMVVNFIISMIIYSLISFVLTFVLIGILGYIAVFFMGIVFPIIGGIKANSGELWKYPLVISIIK